MKNIFTKVSNIFNKKRATPYLQDNFCIYNSDRPVWSEKNYYSFADEGYCKNVIAYRCIDLIATSVASVPLALYRISEDGSRDRIYVHDVLDLLKRPNPSMSKCDFLKSLVSYKLISGNAYSLRVGKLRSSDIPKELYLLRPDRVQIIPGNANIPDAYRYSVNTNYKDYKINKLTGKSDILHFKHFNPIDDWYGLSPIEASSRNIDQHNQAGDWIQSLLQNGAKPSGALVVKGRADDGNKGSLSIDQYNRLKEQINNYYTGPFNAGRPLLLEGGLEWQGMSLSPRDMDLLNLRHNAAREIALAFGVPPQLLGIPGDNTYSNLVEARLALWEQTIMPCLDDILQKICVWLLDHRKYNLTYEKESIDILLTRKEQHGEKINSLSFLTINEKRRLLGFKPREDGNSYK